MSFMSRCALMVAAWVLAGCAATNPRDPLEPFNRTMFEFNDAVDRAALRPTAEMYVKLPSFMQTGVSNFFGNLGDVPTAANNFLQGKFADGLSDTMRFLVNTAFGLGGLLDIGSEAGLQKHNEDFGQTLGKWGVGAGPYVVLPLLGSSTLRDTVALPVDFQTDPWLYADPTAARVAGTVTRVVDQRAALLGASNLLEEAALDRYAFVRDAYLQRRQGKVYDGEPPRTEYDDDAELDAAPLTQQFATLPDATAVEPATDAVVKVKQPHHDGPGAGTEVSK